VGPALAMGAMRPPSWRVGSSGPSAPSASMRQSGAMGIWGEAALGLGIQRTRHQGLDIRHTRHRVRQSASWRQGGPLRDSCGLLGVIVDIAAFIVAVCAYCLDSGLALFLSLELGPHSWRIFGLRVPALSPCGLLRVWGPLVS
jgi:hypothetical protein